MNFVPVAAISIAEPASLPDEEPALDEAILSPPVAAAPFTQSNHGTNGDLPGVPTITHYGLYRDVGLFYFTVQGPAGAPYSLESSTDLENWKPLGSGGTTTGTPNPPSGFLYLADYGPSFFIRIAGN